MVTPSECPVFVERLKRCGEMPVPARVYCHQHRDFEDIGWGISQAFTRSLAIYVFLWVVASLAWIYWPIPWPDHPLARSQAMKAVASGAVTPFLIGFWIYERRARLAGGESAHWLWQAELDQVKAAVMRRVVFERDEAGLFAALSVFDDPMRDFAIRELLSERVIEIERRDGTSVYKQPRVTLEQAIESVRGQIELAQETERTLRRSMVGQPSFVPGAVAELQEELDRLERLRDERQA